MPEILEILNIPKAVATIHRSEDLDFLAHHDVSADCDLLEFRLDSLREHLDQAETVLAAAKLPAIVTARDPAEGGEGNLNVTDRMDMLWRFIPHASLIDVETGSLEEMSAVVKGAHEKGVAVIASFHDFESTPSLEELREVISRAEEGGADVGKIAVTLESMASLFELALLLESDAHAMPLSVMGMGALGKISRLVLASAGSCLNYGYLDKPNAPGQWPAAELKRLMNDLALPSAE